MPRGNISPCCCNGVCLSCMDEQAREFEVILANVANGTDTTICLPHNDTYQAQWRSVPFAGGYVCGWEYLDAGFPGGVDGSRAVYPNVRYLSGTDETEILVWTRTLRGSIPFLYDLKFYKKISGRINCDSFSGQDIPFLEALPNTTICDVSAPPTCTLSLL